MNKNFNPDVIQMDRKFYDRLMQLAQAGIKFMDANMKGHERHIRKFNPVYAQEQHATQDLDRKDWYRRRDLVRDFMQRKDPVNWVLYHKPQSEDFYIPVKLRGRGESKISLYVECLWGVLTKPRRLKISPDTLFYAVPEGYAELTFGRHKGSFRSQEQIAAYELFKQNGVEY